MGALGSNPEIIIERTKKRASEAYAAKEGIKHLSPLEKAFYLRFEELDACKQQRELHISSTLSNAQKQKIKAQLSSLSAKIGRLRTESPITYSRVIRQGR